MARRVIGLTGGIACGKSEVAKLFEANGARIIDADILARKVVEPGSSGLAEVVKAFGKEILLPDGSLNRSALGAIVFGDSSKRIVLEDILHPRIRELFTTELNAMKEEFGESPILYVVPLLFESRNSYKEIDSIVVVSAPPEIAIQRIMARDKCDRDLAEAKVRAQMPIEEKVRRADFVIKNDGKFSDLESQVAQIYSLLA